VNYRLNESGEVVPEHDLKTWAEWYGSPAGRAQRIVQHDEFLDPENDTEVVLVSTVFLGIDHSPLFGGAPVLWETMIFGGKHDSYQDRYRSLKKAKEGHTAAVALAKNPNPDAGDHA
jgi:hypothetical protein